jgi:UDP-glucose 4-epimerase
MRIVVVGATGNVGTSTLEALVDDKGVDSILGVARRRPELEMPRVEWAEADIRSADLVRLFRGADVVVHLRG